MFVHNLVFLYFYIVNFFKSTQNETKDEYKNNILYRINITINRNKI